MNEASLNQSHPIGGDDRPNLSKPEQAQQVPEQQNAQAGQPGIGAQLAAQRDARGWTIEQVASQLNLAVRQIQALEQDNFAALPGIASVRGFIRAYAKLLKIDAAPLVAMLAVEAAPPPIESLHSRRPLTAPFSDARHLPPNGARTSLSKHVLAAAAAGVLLVAALAAFEFGWVRLPAAPVATSAVPSTVSPEPSSAQVVASTSAEVATSAAAAEDKSAASSPSVVPQNTAAGPSTVQSANTPAVAPAAAPVAVPTQSAADKPAAAPRNPLVLKMREDSWLEIRRAGEGAPGSSNVLMSRLEKAGTTETFDVTEPVVVTIGNAGGVDATLRGEPVNLKSGAKSNVAHLNLK